MKHGRVVFGFPEACPTRDRPCCTIAAVLRGGFGAWDRPRRQRPCQKVPAGPANPAPAPTPEPRAFPTGPTAPSGASNGATMMQGSRQARGRWAPGRGFVHTRLVSARLAGVWPSGPGQGLSPHPHSCSQAFPCLCLCLDPPLALTCPGAWPQGTGWAGSGSQGQEPG